MTLLTSNCAASRRYTDPGGAAELRATAKRCRQAPRPQRSARLELISFNGDYVLAPPNRSNRDFNPVKSALRVPRCRLNYVLEQILRCCERPRKRSASEALPSSVSNRYSLSIRTHGSSCRCARQLVATPRQLLLGPEQLQPGRNGGMESQGT